MEFLGVVLYKGQIRMDNAKLKGLLTGQPHDPFGMYEPS